MCILFTVTARRKDPNASEIEVERGEGGRKSNPMKLRRKRLV